MAKKQIADVEDLVGEEADEVGLVEMPKAKKTAAKKTAPAKKAKAAKPAATDDEDLIGKPAAKKTKAKANGKAPAKKAAAKKDRVPRNPELIEKIRAAIRKQKKALSYSEMAEKLGCDIRLLRRTTRGMVEAKEAELSKQGTIGYVRGL